MAVGLVTLRASNPLVFTTQQAALVPPRKTEVQLRGKLRAIYAGRLGADSSVAQVVTGLKVQASVCVCVSYVNEA